MKRFTISRDAGLTDVVLTTWHFLGAAASLQILRLAISSFGVVLKKL
ncbi:hypothetical protein AVEN_153690-1, partial [Araneus ventricosus]